MSYETDHPYQNYDPDWNPDEVMMRLHQLQNRIASTMSEVERTEEGLTEKMSTIEQTVDLIGFEVWENGPDGTKQSRIDIQAGQISQKVSSTDYNGNTIVSMINQTSTTIDIQASKINLVGAVSVLSDITGNLGTITAGTINISSTLTVGNRINIGTQPLGYQDWYLNFGDYGGISLGMGAGSGSTILQYDATSHTFGGTMTLNGWDVVTENQLSSYALASHTHSNYALTNHTHSGYALTGHTHSEYTKDGNSQGLTLSLNSAGTLQITTASGKSATYLPNSWSG